MGQMLQVLSMELQHNIEQARDLSMLIKGKGSLLVNLPVKTAQHRLLQIVHLSLKHMRHLYRFVLSCVYMFVISSKIPTIYNLSN
jgi:hypothetical protein